MAKKQLPSIEQSLTIGIVAALVYLCRGNDTTDLSLISTQTTLLCEFNNTATNDLPFKKVYTCNLYNLNITSAVEIESVAGTHIPGKNDSDVKQICFRTGVVLYIPNGIGKYFKNLKRLRVGDLETLRSLGTKAIQRLNFANMDNLEEINFVSTDIKKVDKDALWDLPNLRVFALTANTIKFLNVRTFEKNLNLKGVAIISTILKHIPGNLFRFNSLLESVYFDNNLLESLSEHLFLTNPKLRTVSFRSNKLKSLPANLFVNNPMLFTVDFDDNALKYIGIDFTISVEIDFVGLELNDCIDARYQKPSTNEFIETESFATFRHFLNLNTRNRSNVSKEYKKLTEFQELIRKNCGLVTSS